MSAMDDGRVRSPPSSSSSRSQSPDDDDTLRRIATSISNLDTGLNSPSASTFLRTEVTLKHLAEELEDLKTLDGDAGDEQGGYGSLSTESLGTRERERLEDKLRLSAGESLLQQLQYLCRYSGFGGANHRNRSRVATTLRSAREEARP